MLGPAALMGPVHAAPAAGVCESGRGDTCAPAVSAAQEPAVRLPDLQTLTPYDLRLVVRAGVRRLYFSNAIVNSGPGPLELTGRYDRGQNVVHTRQQIHRSAGAPLEHETGEMHYHAAHSHWHWDGFARYEIFSLLPYGRPDDLMATSGKVSYCMRDNQPVDSGWIAAHAGGELAVSPRALYGNCGWQRQGISVGWLDIYAWDTPGQDLDVSHLPDGLYVLKSTANPDGILQEADRDNNASVAYFYLQGSRLVDLGENAHLVRLMQAMERVERETVAPAGK
ncbi:MAG TPA: lysyl oxidase family protein [Anaerolineaceae bacterium]|nr:lysyl oxidase family protein [Anaerolineaceae bacterium]